MKKAFCVLFAAGVIAVPALAQEVDVRKAVHCVTLSQQFSDSIKTGGPAANLEDDVKKTATDLAKQGNQACRARDYEGGVNYLREALQKIGRKPWAPGGVNS